MDYEERGVSYFVDRSTGVRVADIQNWSARYTPETQAAQLTVARATRLRQLGLEDWLPIGLLLLAVFWLGLGWRAGRLSKVTPGKAPL